MENEDYGNLKHSKQQQDLSVPDWIDVNNADHVHRLAIELGVTEADILHAVAIYGSSKKMIKEYLKSDKIHSSTSYI